MFFLLRSHVSMVYCKGLYSVSSLLNFIINLFKTDQLLVMVRIYIYIYIYIYML